MSLALYTGLYRIERVSLSTRCLAAERATLVYRSDRDCCDRAMVMAKAEQAHVFMRIHGRGNDLWRSVEQAFGCLWRLMALVDAVSIWTFASS